MEPAPEERDDDFAYQIGQLAQTAAMEPAPEERDDAGPPRVFRTAELVLFHAASCRFRYSSWTSCGVR